MNGINGTIPNFIIKCSCSFALKADEWEFIGPQNYCKKIHCIGRGLFLMVFERLAHSFVMPIEDGLPWALCLKRPFQIALSIDHRCI